jgi:hypothetical protein
MKSPRAEVLTPYLDCSFDCYMSGFWYRVRVATDSRIEVEKLCSDLRVAGGSCLVQRN